MVDFSNVKSYKDAREYVDLHERDEDRLLYVYFVGRNDETGKSWCPDCVDAEPHVMDAFKKHADPTSRALIVDVGDFKTWKDMANPFRHDEQINLSSIPTIIRWQGQERLEGDNIKNPECLEVFFDAGKEHMKKQRAKR